MTEREFEKTVNKYTRLLWSTASKVLNGTGCEQDIEEVVADVFIDLWQKPEQYDATRGSLKSFLCLKCRSKAIDRFRKLSGCMLEDLNEETAAAVAGLPADLPDPEILDAVRTAVDTLDEPAREIVIRRYFRDQKPRAIAKAMELNVKKVENILFRTKAKLRKTLEGIRE